jgi:phosphorylcholine metabolism protein LicD
MILSDSKRSYTVGNITSTVDSKISFRNNCEVEYDQTKIDTLYKNVCDVFVVLMKICPDDHWAVGGTLLGACRHGHILPWDDDADIAITVKGFKKIAKKKCLFDKKGLEIIEYFCGYKIFKNGCVVCDLFVVDYKHGNTLVYSGPYVNRQSTFIINTYFFPLIQFKYRDIFPLRKMKFGGIEINCPNNYETVLINNYTPNVFNEIVFPKTTELHDSWLAGRSASILFYDKFLTNQDKNSLVNVGFTIGSIIMNINMSDFMNKKSGDQITNNILSVDIFGVIDELLTF